MTATVLMAFLISTVAADAKVPEPLARAISSRMAPRTGYLRFEQQLRAIDVDTPVTNRFELRFGVEGIHWTEMGDEEGVKMRDPRTGRPILGVVGACTLRHTVRCRDGDTWLLDEAQSSARIVKTEVAPGKVDLPDPRSFGLFIMSLRAKSPSAWLEELQGKSARWSQREVDGMIEVTMLENPDESEHAEFVWRIDPARDYAVVEVRGYAVGANGSRKHLNTTTNEYEQVDGFWSIKNAEYLSHRRGSSERELVSHSEYDRKDHARTIDADSLRLPLGAEVFDLREQRRNIRARRYVTAGETVTREEWDAMKAPADEERLSLYRSEVAARGMGKYPEWWGAGESDLGLTSVARTPDLWEAYVRRWIIRHSQTDFVKGRAVAASNSLRPAQIESAWAILKDSRKEAEPTLRRQAKELEKAGKIANNAPEPAATPAPSTAGKASASAPSQKTEPSRPSPHDRELERIFEKLKARLTKLLETAQLESAASAGK